MSHHKHTRKNGVSFACDCTEMEKLIAERDQLAALVDEAMKGDDHEWHLGMDWHDRARAIRGVK